MNVFAGFDGHSGGRTALHVMGITPTKYYASEVDKYAMQASAAVFPDIIQMGDITKWREWDINWSTIDLFIGGSPCQGFSMAGKMADIKGHDYNKRVYSGEGKAPSLAANSGGNLEPKVLIQQTPRGKNKGGIKALNGKTPTLSANSWEHNNKLSIQNPCLKNVHYRKLTPRECGRLQTIPEDILDTLLSAGISNSQLYKMFGNGWTIDVIVHIFSTMELPVQVWARQLELFDGDKV